MSKNNNKLHLNSRSIILIVLTALLLAVTVGATIAV